MSRSFILSNIKEKNKYVYICIYINIKQKNVGKARKNRKKTVSWVEVAEDLCEDKEI